MIHIGVGIALLAFGRRLFWLFVGLAGFVAGFEMAQQYLALQPDWIIWSLVLLFSLTGILLAILFQRLAIGLSGFAAGGYIALYAAAIMGAGQALWIYLFGGITGAVLLYLLFDWALILLSSITGASLIVKSLPLIPPLEIFLYVALVVVGVAFQAVWMRMRVLKEKHRGDMPKG